MQKIIAEVNCYYRPPEEELHPIRAYIRAPYDLNEGGTCVCYCHIEGLLEKEFKSFGEGAMQAMCLALYYLKLKLQFFEAQGGRYYYAKDLLTPVNARDLFGDNIAMPDFQKLTD